MPSLVHSLPNFKTAPLVEVALNPPCNVYANLVSIFSYDVLRLTSALH